MLFVAACYKQGSGDLSILLHFFFFLQSFLNLYFVMGNFITGLSYISYKSKYLPTTPRCCRVPPREQLQ